MNAILGRGALLEAVGETLYGEQWKAQMARALNVPERQIRRWLAEEYPVPLEMWTSLRHFAVERRAVLGAIMPQLRDAAKGKF